MKNKSQRLRKEKLHQLKPPRRSQRHQKSQSLSRLMEILMMSFR